MFLSPPTLPYRLSPINNLFREYLSHICVQVSREKSSSYWDFPILVLVEDLVSFS